MTLIAAKNLSSRVLQENTLQNPSQNSNGALFNSFIEDPQIILTKNESKKRI